MAREGEKGVVAWYLACLLRCVYPSHGTMAAAADVVGGAPVRERCWVGGANESWKDGGPPERSWHSAHRSVHAGDGGRRH